jgi:sodium-dependent dicarboxylate transporter 2/3/5
MLKIISGPFAFLLALWLLPFDPIQNKMFGAALWMIVWWTTEAIPIGVTALLPMVLFPALGISDLKTVSANYGNPIIYLFFGGFVLGLAIEKWNLHKRLALNILKRSGSKPRNIIAGSMLATALMSMWISNTAATMMMLPIGMSIISLLEDQFESARSKRNFAICLLLGLAFAANIGGMATLIGTPPNLVFAAIIEETEGIEVGFGTWFVFALPISILLFFAVLHINTSLVFRLDKHPLSGLKPMIETRLRHLGKPDNPEKKVIWVFFATATLWIFRSPLSEIPGLGFLSDTVIALLAVFALFLLPGKDGLRLLEWSDVRKLPWDILLLFGGGLSLAAGLASSGLVSELGQSISGLKSWDWFWIILLITGLAVFITEAMSNVALVTILVPITLVIAPALGGPGLELAIPATLGASCAFMLPIATPPNAIVFSSKMINMHEMIRAGVLINILATIFIAIYAYYMIPFVFN